MSPDKQKAIELKHEKHEQDLSIQEKALSPTQSLLNTRITKDENQKEWLSTINEGIMS